MEEIEKLAKKLDALGHPLRLKIVALLAGGEMYLSEIANRLGVSRALTKIHLKKLQKTGLVRSRIVLLKGEARALRYYKLQEFDIHLTPRLLAEMRGD
jgi:DNA-binding transcriptional ArsR family regulator